jgi:hypothetical protein
MQRLAGEAADEKDSISNDVETRKILRRSAKYNISIHQQ